MQETRKNMCPDAVKLGGKLGALKYPHGIPKSFLLLANKDNKLAMQNTSGSFVVSEIELQVSQIEKKITQFSFLPKKKKRKSNVKRNWAMVIRWALKVRHSCLNFQKSSSVHLEST
jgi:hypothetical protein